MNPGGTSDTRIQLGMCNERSLSWVADKELILSYYNEESPLSTIYCGDLIKFLNSDPVSKHRFGLSLKIIYFCSSERCRNDMRPAKHCEQTTRALHKYTSYCLTLLIVQTQFQLISTEHATPAYSEMTVHCLASLSALRFFPRILGMRRECCSQPPNPKTIICCRFYS